MNFAKINIQIQRMPKIPELPKIQKRHPFHFRLDIQDIQYSDNLLLQNRKALIPLLRD